MCFTNQQLGIHRSRFKSRHFWVQISAHMPTTLEFVLEASPIHNSLRKPLSLRHRKLYTRTYTAQYKEATFAAQARFEPEVHSVQQANYNMIPLYLGYQIRVLTF